MAILIFAHTGFEVQPFFVTLNPNCVWAVVHDRGFLWHLLFVLRIWVRGGGGQFYFLWFFGMKSVDKKFSRARMASFIWIRGFSYQTRDSCLVLSNCAMSFTTALLRILDVLATQIQDGIWLCVLASQTLAQFCQFTIATFDRLILLFSLRENQL